MRCFIAQYERHTSYTSGAVRCVCVGRNRSVRVVDVANRCRPQAFFWIASNRLVRRLCWMTGPPFSDPFGSEHSHFRVTPNDSALVQRATLLQNLLYVEPRRRLGFASAQSPRHRHFNKSNRMLDTLQDIFFRLAVHIPQCFFFSCGRNT